MAQLLIKNGIIITMNSAREILKSDILIQDNKIKEIGTNIKCFPEKEIDASNLVIIPGFIQPHIHLTQTLFRNLGDDLELLDWLKKIIWPLEAGHFFESNKISATLGIAELIMSGTTSIIDMGTVNHTQAICETVKATGYRAVVGKCMMDHGTEVPKDLMENTEDSIKQSIDLMNKWHDCANGRIKYAFAPRFVVSCSEDLLLKVRDIALHNNVMIHTHASENIEEIALVEKERGTRNIKYLEKLGLTGENLVLAHCVWLDQDEMKILRNTGTKVVHCPGSNLKLASGIARIPELLNMKVNVSLASDGAACNNNLDIFSEMRYAALIQKARLSSSTILPAEQIFEIATLGGAKAMGMEHELGSIEKGKKADIILMDLKKIHTSPGIKRDIISQIVYSATSHNVHTTIVDGKILMQNRKLTTINIKDTINQAEKICKKLFMLNTIEDFVKSWKF
ncbi:MAG: N-ethylammeline chlorohydrolase [Desulfobacteraceae bacterium 4572_130]|nr:MAG: N-ethylammeline chlorohydrolase [Desulfobacteraceae bacterium 4572_130]